MDELLLQKDNMKLVKHNGAFYVLYWMDETLAPQTFAITPEDAEMILKDNNEIYDIVIKYYGKALCCESWSLNYNH